MSEFNYITVRGATFRAPSATALGGRRRTATACRRQQRRSVAVLDDSGDPRQRRSAHNQYAQQPVSPRRGDRSRYTPRGV
ncbi:hypothetical protein Y032_0004g2251 [Ancylostoma ceylanicum]|uniref:Uncharacterized protein n=1 Tax=Ancylostoma ceylanicum TaxID=53326 RepID=A0A016VVK5_9BILA|nr:hypothetical protein Y032_0004g2251 [Ancylostoma ceylanicum]